MAKNKYDFIVELLEQKKLTTVQKERILKLSSQELMNEATSDEVILKRIEEIEKRLNDINPPSVDPHPDPPPSDLPKYIDPSGLSKFLSAYNQHPVLKYTCHKIDDNEVIDSINKDCNRSEYNLIDHQNLIEKSYHELVKKYFVNSKINNLILVYLTGKSFDGKYTKWSSENIDINWKSPELFKWADVNPGLVPNPGDKMVSITKNKGFKLSKTIASKLKDQRINYFSNLVIHFKNLFHLKDDNSFREIIENVNISKQWNKKVDFEITDELFRKNLELFTNVDKLIQAYNKILDIIIDVSEKKQLGKPNVALSFIEVKGEVEFALHHRNSVYQKPISRQTLDRIGESQTLLIKKQINGLCDLYLKADFGNNEYAELNLWDGKVRQFTKIDSFEGVKYILKFRK
jgi:hypothetical protein